MCFANNFRIVFSVAKIRQKQNKEEAKPAENKDPIKPSKDDILTWLKYHARCVTKKNIPLVSCPQLRVAFQPPILSFA